MAGGFDPAPARLYAPGLVTPEQAQRLLAELSDTTTRARALVSGQSAEALMNRPRKEAWSVAESLEHLILTADAMAPLADAAISELERGGKRSSTPAGLGLTGWMLVKALEPPPRMKSRTTKPFEPLDVADPAGVAERFAATNARFESLVKRATGFDSARARVVSPFNQKVRYNLYAAFRILLAHARRHLHQATEAARMTAA